jgi:predicted nucleotide-binding protein
MKRQRPKMFIGSSLEGLQIAKAIQANLDQDCETTVWSQGVFGLGEGTLETLVDRLDDFDFASLVLTPDDLIKSRKGSSPTPRDNVLFELGLFIGRLGRKRTLVNVQNRCELLRINLRN